jgi:hypothetical protein
MVMPFQLYFVFLIYCFLKGGSGECPCLVRVLGGQAMMLFVLPGRV